MPNTIDDFWWTVELSRARGDGTDRGQADRLYELLVASTAAEVATFSELWDLFAECAASHRLEAAFTLAAGGFSNDSYDYFRNWLIASGRVTYERIRLDPDSLAELGELTIDDLSFEYIEYIQMDAFEHIAGQGTRFSSGNHCDRGALKHLVETYLTALPAELSHDWQSFADAARLCPKLARLYDR